ncbi:hypothetical protein GLOTRDRAFT_33218 [Gloeophyllum trabeum ATCC 11539]|uniref:Fms interacting protein n=1 Tax=Gloeophyllum trabeum (strain ATCC 11539 / FP-39264 / Madison 617) TaxID=670483 RepID=S7RWI3_GLOTA|nr:uncharacterized protein GLOTRDRAFT_33218 [Gloeophyllum trabeum ATCC 11539]EPQ59250.1 hypothetical protein GLOTRDRAFT_33218 [Gloeophyllum trabeum ATCC 11539]
MTFATGLANSPDAVVDSLRDLVSPRYANQDADAIHHYAGALIARLRVANRAANAATRAHKQVTADARHEMDQAHLGLQNLLYEKRYLEREIEKCRQFASIYQDVPIYEMEEFLQLAPAELRTEEVLADEHQLLLNRLSFELSERQKLSQRYEELRARRDQMLKESKAKQALTETVKGHIDTLMKTALEIQKKVDDVVPSAPEPSTVATAAAPS